MRRGIVKGALEIAIAVGILTAILWALKIGLDKQERIDCEKYAQWQSEYRLFEVSTSTVARCEAIGIKIAPEKAESHSEPNQAEYRYIEATVYAYSADEAQTDNKPTEMASGKEVYNGAIACPQFLDFGQVVEIDGQLYTCEDRMAPRYRQGNNFDIYKPSAEEAKQWGKRIMRVKIYQ